MNEEDEYTNKFVDYYKFWNYSKYNNRINQVYIFKKLITTTKNQDFIAKISTLQKKNM